MWPKLETVIAAAALVVGGCRSEKAGTDAGPRVHVDESPLGHARPPFDARPVLARAKLSAVSFSAVNREREVVVAGEGLADRERKIGASAATVFEAASIAKLIVAVSVMQLVEQNALDLDTNVGSYLGFAVRHPRFDAPITLRMLLTHRAAIRDRHDQLAARADGNPLEPFLKRYLLEGTAPRASAFLDTSPGTTSQYSNVGAALAALVVERVAGEDFARHSTRRVFEPLRMPSTRWSAPDAKSPLRAIPYARRGSDFVALPPPSHAVYPAVDLHSTSGDLARFARAILRDGELDGARILSPSSVRAMLRPDAPDRLDGADSPAPGERPDPRDATAGTSSGQALAWQLRTLGGARVVGHEGEDEGATTALFLDREAGTAAVILANGDAFGSGDATRAAAIETMLADLLARAR